MNHWEIQLREESRQLTSLQYFRPEFMSLNRPHPLWTTCGSNPFEVHKATTQSRMLSGRYMTDKLRRHWSGDIYGLCRLPTCTGTAVGSLEHLLLDCPALQLTRTKMEQLLWDTCSPDANLLSTVLLIFQQGKTMQFLLDYSVLPETINLVQQFGVQVLDKLF